ncbi:hypothetical protein IFM89_006225, partial [Coptis chinensis]
RVLFSSFFHSIVFEFRKSPVEAAMSDEILERDAQEDCLVPFARQVEVDWNLFNQVLLLQTARKMKMWSKKLLISILRTLGSFSSILVPNQKFYRVLYYSSQNLRESKGCGNHFLENYSYSRKNFSSNVSSSRCWNCNVVATLKPFLACQSCRSIQPVDPFVDYFQIFHLEKIYGIDDTHLESKYRNWQKKLHPDLVHTKSELQLEGVHVDEEKIVSEPELLTEMMEFREAVEEATSPQALKEIEY